MNNTKLYGIFSPLANEILSKMACEKIDFATALSDIQRDGGKRDISVEEAEGFYAVDVLYQLIKHCFGKVVSAPDIFHRRLSFITPLDVEMAQKFGYAIKPLSIAQWCGDCLSARVHPTMIPSTHPLASVFGASQAIQYSVAECGFGMVRSFGSKQEVSLADMLTAVDSLMKTPPTTKVSLENAKIQNELNLKTKYYIRFSVLDKPGVLVGITSILDKHHISLRHVYQLGDQQDRAIPLITFTHTAEERDVRQALKEIDSMHFVTQVTKIIRVEE